MFIKFDRTPIVVEVHGDRWDAYSQHNPPNYRDKQLLKILNDLGGVNESVAEGSYHFNVTRWRPFKKQNLEVTLTKIEE